METGLLGAVQKALSALKSPYSLLAFGTWWIALSFLIQPPPSTLFVLLLAAWLGAATGTAVEQVEMRYFDSRRYATARSTVARLWDESLTLPPSVGSPLRIRLELLGDQLVHRSILAADAADQLADLVDQLTGEQTKFLQEKAAGNVGITMVKAIEVARVEALIRQDDVLFDQLRFRRRVPGSLDRAASPALEAREATRKIDRIVKETAEVQRQLDRLRETTGQSSESERDTTSEDDENPYR